MALSVILQLRIYALYFLNKKVLFFVALFFIISTASAATIMGLVLSNISSMFHIYKIDDTISPVTIAANAEVIAGLDFCMPLTVPKYLYAYWIPLLAFESLLCCMSIFRGFQAFRQRHSVFQSGKHIMTILLRDSIVYFLMWGFYAVTSEKVNWNILQHLLHVPRELFALGYGKRGSLLHILSVHEYQADEHLQKARPHWDSCRIYHGDVMYHGQQARFKRPLYEAWAGARHLQQRAKPSAYSIQLSSGCCTHPGRFRGLPRTHNGRYGVNIFIRGVHRDAGIKK